MPLVQVFTSARPTTSGAQASLLAELSLLLSRRFGKPEQWVMTCLVPGLAMTFAGTTAPTAFVAVKNVGKMSPEDTAALSPALCELVGRALLVKPERIYVEFTDAVGHLWGWNGETFGS
jgi:phenylpyruvate tautomerase PptA (4-oxalocrotonate tautomerase family)